MTGDGSISNSQQGISNNQVNYNSKNNGHDTPPRSGPLAV